MSSAGALALTRAVFYMRQRGGMDQLLARKLTHIGSAVGFVLTWPLYAPGWQAGYVAATVPALFCIQTGLVGLGLLNDPGQVKATSRSGKAKELLAGPVVFATAIAILTATQFLRPSSVIGIHTLGVGDGLADIVGRRWKSGALPWNKHKTWGGSLACWVGGFFGSSLALAYLSATCPHAALSLRGGQLGVLLASGVGALAESMPFVGQFDNSYVALAAASMAGVLQLP